MTSFGALRDPYGHLEDKPALDQPTSILLGINVDAAAALQATGVDTILDLAQSQLFGNAVDICLLAERGEGRFAATGRIPSDVLRPPGDTPLRDLPAAPLEVLNWYGDVAQLHDLDTALDVATVRDLASWPPYWVAREIYGRVYGVSPGGEVETSTGTPEDLLPSSGEYPTERVQYEALLFDGFQDGETDDGHPIDGLVDVASLTSEDGYRQPAVGGVLTFTQSWYTKALSLGNLIHSVALAPGESTKIAMIDWSRRTRTGAAESITQGEEIVSDTVRARAISEVTLAVARETQRGESAAHASSRSSQSGEASGSAHLRDLDLYGGLDGQITSPGVDTSGTTAGRSRGDTDATGWSTTSGERDIAASLSQSVVDRTHQASHSVRSRRATIVREASQAEREQISTRTLTNYNHMHAMTIEYYEVVQLYRMSVELTKAERCAFIPMKLLDFHDQRVVNRFRTVLANAALTSDVAQILAYPAGSARIQAAAIRRGDVYRGPATRENMPTDRWSEKAFDSLAAPGFMPIVLSDGRLVVPADFTVKVVICGGAGIGEVTNMTIQRDDGDTLTETGQYVWTLPDPVSMRHVTKATVTFDDRVEPEDKTFLFMAGSLRGVDCSLEVPVIPEAPGVDTVVFDCEAATVDSVSNLIDNQLYYSQAVWRSLDPATIGIMLSELTWPVEGVQRPLVELVDPTPVAVAANYLVLRLSGEPAAVREQWLTEKHITMGERREELVPIPSGGVFAEAVLGRSNSAERLEMTRFWNWQDSPIPVAAPDIAPVQAGSRRDPDTTTPGALDAPVISVVTPPAVPDPHGLTAILAALQNGNMFRDMSGLAATIGLSQAGLTGAQQAATAAALQAGHNAEAAADLGAKVAGLLADVLKTYVGKVGKEGGGLASLTGGLTGQGAKIEQGKEMDERDAKGKPSDGSMHPPIPGDPPGQPRRMDGTAAAPGSNEIAAFRAALGSADGSVDDALFEQAASRVLGTGEGAVADSGEWVYWSQLITHTPPATLVADLHDRGLEVLPIGEAWGDVNLDYYPVRIAELPVVAGQLFSAQDLIQHVRAHIDDFVDTDNSSFPFLDPAIDGPTWNSDDPLGTVIDINVNVGGLLEMPPWEVLIDHSLVTCSGADDHRWIFTTMQGGSAAKHPVSGNRMFAVDEAGSDWILYTMGADRATSFGDWAVNAGGLIWRGADKLWLGFQERVAEFVNDNGGEAEVATRHSRRYSWKVIERTLGLPPEVRL